MINTWHLFTRESTTEATHGLLLVYPTNPLQHRSGTYGSRAIYGSSGDGIWLPDNFGLKKLIHNIIKNQLGSDF